MDSPDGHPLGRTPTASLPLLGLTVLAVEDSRFASEALRLLCQRSGARLRRADSLAAARRHLRVYRPGCLIVDMGLPDGSGADLLAEAGAASPRVDILLAMSGDPGAEDAARAAGADAFLAKPIVSLAAFQATILACMPPDRRPPGPRLAADDRIAPDPLAYRDDLAHAADVLSLDDAERGLDYVTQFLGGVARSAGDAPLDAAVAQLAHARRTGGQIRPEVARLAALVQARLVPTAPL